MTAAEQSARLAAARVSTSAMLAGFEAQTWSDADLREPSLLAGWTRGHVLTHLARNADGINRSVAGALRGQSVARYPHGDAGRNADIEAGSGRPAGEVLADLRDCAERLDRVFGAVAEAGGWELDCDAGATAWTYLEARWREVEIHRVDAAGNYTPDQWPEEFVAYLLPEVQCDIALPDGLRVEIAAVTEVRGDLVQAPAWAVLAWLIGRPPPELAAAPRLERWR